MYNTILILRTHCTLQYFVCFPLAWIIALMCLGRVAYKSLTIVTDAILWDFLINVYLSEGLNESKTTCVTWQKQWSFGLRIQMLWLKIKKSYGSRNSVKVYGNLYSKKNKRLLKNILTANLDECEIVLHDWAPMPQIACNTTKS